MLPRKLSSEALWGALCALQIASARYYLAVNAQAAARFKLDEARAQLLLAGVEGKNADARDAQLRLSLTAEHEQLEQETRVLNHARAELEHTRLTWDCLRYELRLLSLASAVPTEV